MEDLGSPLCIALDSDDREGNERMAQATAASAGMFKVGLTNFIAGGPEVVARLARQRPVFLDLKLHDIPQQVAGAVRSAAATGASLTTVHAVGGRAMLAAAADAAEGEIDIVAVTILTSLDDAALDEIGLDGPAEKAVLRLADLALASGIAGLVCSPLEVAAIRDRFGPRASGGPLLVVPGIRPRGGGDDQKRTADPASALRAGADILVVGRPITGAADPGAAAARLLGEARG